MSEILKGRVGESAEHLITNIRNEQRDLEYGNVLRRTCQMFGEGACKEACRLDGMFAKQAGEGEKIIPIDVLVPSGVDADICADVNLKKALDSVGLSPKQVLMIGVTANNVGFGDLLPSYEAEGKIKHNSHGWRELPGFNAFFARSTEVSALGRRLADCADINFEFKDDKGVTVIGFEHGTRTNMFGAAEYPFDNNGEKISFTRHVLGRAIDHYGADPASITITLAAAIKAKNFTKSFDSVQKMEEHLPGWWRAGYVDNVSDPSWAPDSEGAIPDADKWEADTRRMIIDDIKSAMKVLSVPDENLSMDGIIDPGDSNGMFSSHQFRAQYGDTRDLYLTYVKKSEATKRLEEAKEKAQVLLSGESEAADIFGQLAEESPDAAEMVFASDAGLSGQDAVDYWDEIGRGDGGFYDHIRENGCSSCGSHTPGCCDGCA